MYIIGKKMSRTCLWLLLALFLLLPGLAWADATGEPAEEPEEEENQIYAIYAADKVPEPHFREEQTTDDGQTDADQEAENANGNLVDVNKTDETPEPAANGSQDTEPTDIPIVGGESQEPDTEIEPGTGSDIEPGVGSEVDLETDPDTENEPGSGVEGFPDLPATLQVGLWDAASQSSRTTQVAPVNLALRGRYLASDVPAMAMAGRTLVPVRLISEQLEASVVWDKESNTVTIALDDQTIVLTIGSSVALVNGQQTPVPDEVSVALVTYDGVARTMVPVRFVAENLEAVVSYDPATRIVNITPPVRQQPSGTDYQPWPAPEPEPGSDLEPEPEPEPEPVDPPGIDENGNMLRRVVIDAGHGGKDPGTNGGGHVEKSVNLAVALKAQACLEAAGFEVIMTRSDDSFVELLDRAALTVEADAPIFVSIHCNSAANITSANGIETYAAPEDSGDAELAGYIQKQLIAATGAKDRGVKTSSLVVLTHNYAPACLVEIGFMTNSAECAKIVSDSYQQKLAEAIAAGVEAYFAAKQPAN